MRQKVRELKVAPRKGRRLSDSTHKCWVSTPAEIMPSRLPERQGREHKRRQSFQIYEQLHHVAHTPKEQGKSLTNPVSGHGLGGVSLPSASQKRLRREFPGGPVVRTWCFYCWGQVQSPVREVRYWKLQCGQKKKKGGGKEVKMLAVLKPGENLQR